jgi:hypothetical protein
LFAARERGRAKHTSSKWKAFWDKVSEIVRASWLEEEEINKTCQVDDEGQPVSKILKSMLAD